MVGRGQRRRLVPVGRVRAPECLDPRRDFRRGEVPPAAEELLKGGDGAAAGRMGSEAAEFGEFLWGGGLWLWRDYRGARERNRG